jgi:hypothetical protein
MISIGMHMVSTKEIRYKIEYIPVHFNFKTKEVEVGKEMTAEITLNNL